MRCVWRHPYLASGLASLGQDLGAGAVADLSDVVNWLTPWKGGHFASIISRPNLAAVTQTLSFQNKALRSAENIDGNLSWLSSGNDP